MASSIGMPCSEIGEREQSDALVFGDVVGVEGRELPEEALGGSDDRVAELLAP